MDRQPNRRLRRIRPLDTMAQVSRDVDERANLHLERLFTFEPQPCRSTHNQHPLIAGLIVPEARRACVAVGDDAFYAQSRRSQQRLEQFFRHGSRQITKQISGREHGWNLSWYIKSHVILVSGPACGAFFRVWRKRLASGAAKLNFFSSHELAQGYFLDQTTDA